MNQDNKKKLRVGLLIDSFDIPAWSFKMFENIIDCDFAEIVLVVKNDNDAVLSHATRKSKTANNRGRILSTPIKKLLESVYGVFVERNTYIPDADRLLDSAVLLGDIPVLKVKTEAGLFSGHFDHQDILRIEEYDIDILVQCGFGVLKGDILNAAKYGIWSFHHGDNRVNQGGPDGFWESMEGWPETGSVLKILTEDPDNDRVLYRSYSCTDRLSVQDNRSGNYWKSLSFMTRKMRELQEVGERRFFEKLEYENRNIEFYSEKRYVTPGNYELMKLTVRKLIEKIGVLYNNRLFFDQWILMFHLKEGFSSSLWRYKKIIPPKDRFWADPHIIYRGNQYYIFFEEYLYSSGKGHISVMKMDEDGNYQTPEIVLDRSYHLSYPFVFEHEGACYMIPESMSNRTIELYKCTDFPGKWEFQMNLMEGVDAVDATLFFRNGKWWMFVNIVENEGASSWDELFLFSSSDLFSNNWAPHPQNPIVSDCKSSRPAGKIFSEKGVLYRPSQNCSTRYGYGFNLNEITALDEDTYSERVVTRVRPNWEKRVFGTHTFSRVRSLHVIDALYKRRQ